MPVLLFIQILADVIRLWPIVALVVGYLCVTYLISRLQLMEMGVTVKPSSRRTVAVGLNRPR